MLRKNSKMAIILIMILSITIIFTACTKPKQEQAEDAKKDVEKVEDKPTTQPDRLRIGYLTMPGNVLYFIANEKGYFTDENLDVEMYMFKSGSEGISALISDKIDTGCFGTGAELSLLAKEAEISIFGGQMSQGSGIITKPDRVDEFKDFKNYKGKTLGLVRMSTGDVLFRTGLIEAGLEINKDVKIVELDSAASIIEAIKKDEIDAGGVWIPHIKNSELQGLKVAMYSGEVLKMHP